MTFLQNYIKNHPLTWKKDIINLKIQIKEENNLILFKYDIDADFNNPIVKECRGIILDSNSFNIVCRGFDKFFNYQESYADEIDWSSACVQEKIDGSIIKLWFYADEWHWSTNGTIDANNATANSITNHSFMDLIRMAENYHDIQFDQLNTDYTYIFELVSPENKIVIDYGNKYHLYHLGTRNNLTGEEYNLDIGIDKPHVYNINSFEDCIDAVGKLNTEDSITNEGFVVVDGHWNRVKVKSPVYVAMHHLMGNHIFTKTRCLELLINDPDKATTVIKEFPQYTHIFKYYEYKIAEVKYEITNFINLTRNLYEEYSHDRKIVANIIKKHKYATFGFMSLDREYDPEEFIKNISVQQFDRLVDQYVERDLLEELKLT